jgi:hypothetical protein
MYGWQRAGDTRERLVNGKDQQFCRLCRGMSN